MVPSYMMQQLSEKTLVWVWSRRALSSVIYAAPYQPQVILITDSAHSNQISGSLKREHPASTQLVTLIGLLLSADLYLRPFTSVGSLLVEAGIR